MVCENQTGVNNTVNNSVNGLVNTGVNGEEAQRKESETGTKEQGTAAERARIKAGRGSLSRSAEGIKTQRKKCFTPEKNARRFIFDVSR